MPDEDWVFEHRYTTAPRQRKNTPTPGPNVSTIRLVRPVTDDIRARALEVLRSYEAMDVAEMLGLT